MKTTITNLIFVTALSFSSAALAAEQAGSKPAAAQPASGSPPAAAGAAPQAVQPTVQPAAPDRRSRDGRYRSKSLDLRHCLDLQDNTAIAKCAGE